MCRNTVKNKYIIRGVSKILVYVTIAAFMQHTVYTVYLVNNKFGKLVRNAQHFSWANREV